MSEDKSLPLCTDPNCLEAQGKVTGSPHSRVAYHRRPSCLICGGTNAMLNHESLCQTCDEEQNDADASMEARVNAKVQATAKALIATLPRTEIGPTGRTRQIKSHNQDCTCDTCQDVKDAAWKARRSQAQDSGKARKCDCSGPEACSLHSLVPVLVEALRLMVDALDADTQTNDRDRVEALEAGLDALALTGSK